MRTRRVVAFSRVLHAFPPHTPIGSVAISSDCHAAIARAFPHVRDVRLAKVRIGDVFTRTGHSPSGGFVVSDANGSVAFPHGLTKQPSLKPVHWGKGALHNVCGQSCAAFYFQVVKACFFFPSVLHYAASTLSDVDRDKGHTHDHHRMRPKVKRQSKDEAGMQAVLPPAAGQSNQHAPLSPEPLLHEHRLQRQQRRHP